jgi:hypothetical protein
MSGVIVYVTRELTTFAVNEPSGRSTQLIENPGSSESFAVGLSRPRDAPIVVFVPF